jgi:hypothetical protein
VTADLRAALRALAESLPADAVIPVLARDLLELVNGDGRDLAHDGAPVPAPGDRLLSAEALLDAKQAAALLHVAPRWLYRRAASLPFTRRLAARTLRFSEPGLRRWLERQRTPLTRGATGTNLVP